MALNWNLSSVKDWETLINEDGYPHKTTFFIIHACMLVSLGSITQRNYLDFFVRLRIYESCFGALGDKPITLADVEKHIGLSTNCTNDSYPQFLKKVYNNVKREATE
jgi:hypothetical protein